MIQETQNPYHLFLISQKSPEIKGVDYSPVDFLKYMLDGLNSKNMKIFVEISEGQKINGFLVASIVSPMERDEVFIDLAWVDPKNNGLGVDLQKQVENWARELKIRKISTMIVRGEQAYRKRYKFQKEATVLCKYLSDKEIKLKEQEGPKDE